MTRKWLLLSTMTMVLAASGSAFAQDLGAITTIGDSLSYSVYSRQKRAQQQQVQRLTKRVQTVEKGAAKKVGEAAPRSGFQTQGDYFQNHLR